MPLRQDHQAPHISRRRRLRDRRRLIENESLVHGRHAQSIWMTIDHWRRRLGIGGSVGALLIALIGVADARPMAQARSVTASVSRDQADRIMKMNYTQFAAPRSSAARPLGYRWDTDGCTPDWAPRYFTRACYLHDFGYRNYGSARKEAPHLSPTMETKNWIDARFYEEMNRICDDEANTHRGRAACKDKATEL